jgi:hypothetical protein
VPRDSALDSRRGARERLASWLLQGVNLWVTVAFLSLLLARRAKGGPPQDVPPGAGDHEPARDADHSAHPRAAAAVGLWDRDSVKAIPVLLIVLLLLKAYVVSNYSLVTASALVTAAPVAVLVGTVTSFLHIVVLILFLVTSAWLYNYRRDNRARSTRNDPPEDSPQPQREIALVVFAVWVMCLLFLPVPMSIPIYERKSLVEIAYAVGVCALGVLAYGVSNRVAKRLRRTRVDGGWFVVLVGVALVVPTLKTPWMPSEIWVLDQPIAPRDLHDLDSQAGGAEQVLNDKPVVFVLSVDGGWAVGLDVDTRLVLEIPAKNVKGRVVCKYAGQPANTLPLYALLFGDKWETPNRYCENLLDPPGQFERLIPDDTANDSASFGMEPLVTR